MMVRKFLPLVTRQFSRSRVLSCRSISYTVTRMGEGDTGGIRAGGAASGDAFTKRETANESKYVKEKEMEKLAALKAKIKEQKQHLEELDSLVDGQLEGKGKDKDEPV